MDQDQVVTALEGTVSESHVQDLLEQRAWVSVHAEQFTAGAYERLAEHASKYGGRLIIREAVKLSGMHRERIAKKAVGAVTFEL